MNPTQTQQKLWFKRKRYGWGWTPTSWQGWMTVLVYTVLLVALGSTIDQNSSLREISFMIILPYIILTAALIRICYAKGERPKWQWGTDTKENN